MFKSTEEFRLFLVNFCKENNLTPTYFSHLINDEFRPDKTSRILSGKQTPSLDDFFFLQNFFENFNGEISFQKTLLIWNENLLYASAYANFTNRWETPSFLAKLKKSQSNLYFLVNFYLTHKDECILVKNPAYYNRTYTIGDLSWEGVLPSRKYPLLPQTKLL